LNSVRDRIVQTACSLSIVLLYLVYTQLVFVWQAKITGHVMSNDAITFHHMTPGQMFMFDYLLYRLNRH